MANKGKNSLLHQLRVGIAWPELSKKPQQIHNPQTLRGRLLNAISSPTVFSATKSGIDYTTGKTKYTKKEKQLLALWAKVPRNFRWMTSRTEKVLLTIIKVDKNNSPAYNRLGILYARRGDFDKGIDYFKTAAGIKPSLAAFHNLGLAYYHSGDYKQSAKFFKKAVQLDDSSTFSHLAYAKVHEKLGNDKAMIQSLEKAVECERNIMTLALLHNVYVSRGMHAEAAVIELELLEKIAIPLAKIQKALGIKSRALEYIGPPAVLQHA